MRRSLMIRSTPGGVKEKVDRRIKGTVGHRSVTVRRRIYHKRPLLIKDLGKRTKAVRKNIKSMRRYPHK